TSPNTAARGMCKPRTTHCADALNASEMASDGGSSSLQLPCVFSPKSRQYLALCAQDGRLRVWNTDSKTLHQEYVPSAHLSATCTCIAWGPCRTLKEGPQRKKRKSEAVQAEERADLLAMGTAAGSVLIYSTVKGALHCTLDGGHTGGVNCVQWHPKDSLLYSGSDDTNIIEWDLQSGKTRSVWKADRAAITGLCVSPDGKLLLSAAYVIKLWNLETKEIYRQKFTGHSTAVTTLCFATTRPPDGNGLYFLSGAAHDRLLSVWQVRDDGRDKNSVVSFTLTDEPQHINLIPSNSKNEAVRLAVVCKDGQLHLFEHFLNGPCKKPLSPSCTVQLSDTKDSPAPIPLLAAALATETRTVMLAYGNHLQPVMERALNTSERHICLTRDVFTNLSLSTETNVSKVKTPFSAKSKVLVPGLPGHQAPKGSSQASEKRKKDIDTKEMSIAERLGEIDLATGSSDKGAPKSTASLQTDNFAVLLVQGLESNDANILNKVFQTRKEIVIKKTVARIPLSAVLPLVEEITKRLQGHPFSAKLMVQWLKAVITHHTSYLASLPDLVTQLGVLYHMSENRVKLLPKLTKLHGKLFLLTTQVNSVVSVMDVDHAAKLVYEEGKCLPVFLLSVVLNPVCAPLQG
uniref:WD repeat domain 43 n=1 Tax=Neogobius melanostomus TaxID=47308 RepID=A0A8C6UZU9_9GOBI